MDSNNRGAGSIPASILRDKINEMYDHFIKDTRYDRDENAVPAPGAQCPLRGR